MSSVHIRGDGVAARCCAHLFEQAGVDFSLEVSDRPRVPAIMLSAAALALLRDVFDSPELLSVAPRIQKRFVRWGAAPDPVQLEHSGVVVSEEALRTGLPLTQPGTSNDAAWQVFSARPLPSHSETLMFGSRSATATRVSLREAAMPEACWIESLQEGWLFLIASGPGYGWLLAVGGASEELLASSRLVGAQIESVTAHGMAGLSFPASPRILVPLGGPDWLACGAAAMGFDPLCGDGTAHAVREAILASAVIQAAQRGEPADHLLQHYQTRLLAGFRRHLELCLHFYESGGEGDWWRQEADSVRRGIAWCAEQQPGAPAFRYRLEGFNLIPVRT